MHYQHDDPTTPHSPLHLAGNIEGLRGPTKLLLFQLAWFADSYGFCFPSRKTLCNRTGLKPTAVKAAIKDLADQGVIDVYRAHRRDNSQATNVYRMTYAMGDQPLGIEHYVKLVESRIGLFIKGKYAHDGSGGVTSWGGREATGGGRETTSSEQSIYITTTPLSARKEDSEEGKSNSRKLEPAKPQATMSAARLLLDTYNENRGSLPRAASITPKREKKLDRFAADSGGLDQAIENLRKATIVASQNKFYRQKGYGLDNLLANDNWIKHAEAYQADEEAPEFNVGDRVMVRLPRGMRHVEAPGVILEMNDRQAKVRVTENDRETEYMIGYGYLRLTGGSK